MPEGDGMKSTCVYGDTVTPNEHKLARQFLLLDNYYASGKSSAEGHQWTDAAMTSDYVEKMVRAWFRSYPHVQEDALVYNKEGFLWNNALDSRPLGAHLRRGLPAQIGKALIAGKTSMRCTRPAKNLSLKIRPLSRG
jgi:hypothetical protein